MITERDIKFINAALTAGKLSDYPRVHIGAAIADKSVAISTGNNKQKTHPIQKIYNEKYLPYKTRNSLHAEIDAIIRADDDDLRGTTLYVARRGLNNRILNCRPCPACMGLIKDSGIERVVYTINDGIKEMFI